MRYTTLLAALTTAATAYLAGMPIHLAALQAIPGILEYLGGLLSDRHGRSDTDPDVSSRPKLT